MNDTPRTQELRDDLAGIASEAPIWKLFKKLDCRQLERELTAVTEQRDELLRYNEAFRKETLICADCDAIRKEEYDQAIEQRDRLAEAMTRIINIYENPEKGCIPSSSDMYDEALQSLTPNEL